MSATPQRLAAARTVADAVLYEGYLLYPYRASSDKNRSRWQFGVLGPPGAAERGLGEPATMSTQTLVRVTGDAPRLVVRLRFLQLQRRQLHDPAGAAVDRLDLPGGTELSWDEATEQELVFRVPLDRAGEESATVDGGEEVEELLLPDGSPAGSLARLRWPLVAALRVGATPQGAVTRLDVEVRNDHPVRPATRDDATRTSLLGAHLLVEADGCAFVSVVDPPQDAREAAAGCRQDRCWPFLAGVEGEDDLLLGSPIILYDHPAVAPESAGALFDATEIDEILTLRVMTMTDSEKAEARATDPRAAAIIDRCDAMSPADLQQLHGVLRDPRGPFDEQTDAQFDPDSDAVVVDGVRVAKGSRVRVHPNRRADAQDLFFDGQVARVTGVLCDVDGGTHVALVLEDDPAADLHDWYGRYFYFAPDEIEPLTEREESRP